MKIVVRLTLSESETKAWAFAAAGKSAELSGTFEALKGKLAVHAETLFIHDGAQKPIGAEIADHTGAVVWSE